MHWIEGVDPCSDQATRVVFWPTVCADTPWTPCHFRGEWLNPDSLPAAWIPPERPRIDSAGLSAAPRPVTNPGVQKRLRSELRAAQRGDRNNTLNRVVYEAARLGVLTDEFEATIRRTAWDIGLTASEVEATLHSARESGGKALTQAVAEAFPEGPLKPTDELLAYTPADVVTGTSEFDAAISGEKSYRIQWACDTTPIEPKELWYDMLPLGALTIISGMGGIGKSTLDAWLAAKASRGELDGDIEGPVKTLLVMDEDDWSRDTVPRLMAAEADLTKIGTLFVKAPGSDIESRVPSFPQDVGMLKRVIEENGFKLIILDVVTSMMSVGADINSVTDVRSLLNPLLRIAQETESLIVCVNHWRKASGSISHMISGSAAFRDTARCVWMVVMDREGQRFVKIDKYNRSAKAGKTFQFDIASKNLPGWSRTIGAITDFRESSTDAQDVLDYGAEGDPEGDREAGDWLSGFLADTGPSTWLDIQAAGKAEGYSVAQIKKARVRLKCVNRSFGNTDGRPGRKATLWYLPGMPFTSFQKQLPPIDDLEKGAGGLNAGDDVEVSTGPAVLAEIPSGLPAHGADSGVGTGEIATADRPARGVRTPRGSVGRVKQTRRLRRNGSGPGGSSVHDRTDAFPADRAETPGGDADSG